MGKGRGVQQVRHGLEVLELSEYATRVVMRKMRITNMSKLVNLKTADSYIDEFESVKEYGETEKAIKMFQVWITKHYNSIPIGSLDMGVIFTPEVWSSHKSELLAMQERADLQQQQEVDDLRYLLVDILNSVDLFDFFSSGVANRPALLSLKSLGMFNLIETEMLRDFVEDQRITYQAARSVTILQEWLRENYPAAIDKFCNIRGEDEGIGFRTLLTPEKVEQIVQDYEKKRQRQRKKGGPAYGLFECALVKMGVGWTPCVVTGVQYTTTEKDAEQLPQCRTGQIMPFRMHSICKPDNACLVPHGVCFKPLTGEQLLRKRVFDHIESDRLLPLFQAKNQDMFWFWLRLAVRLRYPEAAEAIATWNDFTYESIDRIRCEELLSDAFKRDPKMELFEREAQELDKVLEFIEMFYDVDWKTYPTIDGMSLAELAVDRKDWAVLKLLLREEKRICKANRRGEQVQHGDLYKSPIPRMITSGKAWMVNLCIKQTRENMICLDEVEDPLRDALEGAEDDEALRVKLTELKLHLKSSFPRVICSDTIADMTISVFRQAMQAKETEFLLKCFDFHVHPDKLEAFMESARREMAGMDLNSYAAREIETLESSLYVLGGCLESQPKLLAVPATIVRRRPKGYSYRVEYSVSGVEFSDCSLLESFAKLGDIAKAMWLRQYVDTESPVFMAALKNAVELNDADFVDAMLKTVHPEQWNSPEQDRFRKALLDDAIRSLSHEVLVRLSLRSGEGSAQRLLLSVGDSFVGNGSTTSAVIQRKAKARFEILQLVARQTWDGVTPKSSSPIDWRPVLVKAISTLLHPRSCEKGLPVPITQEVVEFIVRMNNSDLKAVWDVANQFDCSNAPDWFKNDLLVRARAEMRPVHEAVLADKIHPVAQGFLTRESVKSRYGYGKWAKVLLHIVQQSHQRTYVRPIYCKSWTQLDCQFVVQKDYTPFEATVLEHQTDVDDDRVPESEYELSDSILAPNPRDEGKVVFKIVLLEPALRWLRVFKDAKYREMFWKRLDLLARGGESYALKKPLKGSKHKAVETKLDTGKRIIWTEEKDERRIWYVCDHDAISRCVELIDLSHDRVISAKKDKFDNGEKDAIMFADPAANVPLKMFTVTVDDKDPFLSDVDWTPPLKLTPSEEAVVTRKGTVLLLGRSGTGKTLCVYSRMARDRVVYGPETRQLFVARTQRLCDQVSIVQEQAGDNLSNAVFARIRDFVPQLSSSPQQWDRALRVDYRRFRSKIWPDIKDNEKELDSFHVWTQIRSFIKESYEASSRQRPLLKSEYLDTEIIVSDRCRLDNAARRRAYALYRLYQNYLDSHGLWDEMDRVAAIGQQLKERMTRELEEDGRIVPMYDRVYVDEVQDMTQAELALLFHVTGNNVDAMFLAGDNAQSVAEGVDFRFEEVRSLVYNVSNKMRSISKPDKLVRNYRSHEGILQVSNLVLDRLYLAFPNSLTKLDADMGLVLGPRPGLIRARSDEISRIIETNQRVQVLVRDEHKSHYEEQLGPSSSHAILGIRESKGLEFSDVLILDFFSNVADPGQQKTWKQLFLDKISIDDLPITMELELKLLYTAITRSCDRLFFVETSESKSFDAWRRCLVDRGLANVMMVDELIGQGGTVMLPDEWMKQGIELASQAGDVEFSVARNHLDRARDCFGKAGNKELESKAVAHFKALELENELLAASENGEDVDFASAVIAYLDAGMLMEASRLCQEYCKNLGLVLYLPRAIKKLGEGPSVNIIDPIP